MVPSMQPSQGSHLFLFARMVPEWFPVCNPQLRKQNKQNVTAVSEGRRAQATRLERNDGSTVTANGLGLNSHTPPLADTTLGRAHSTVRTSQDCVRTYRRMRER
jgi:hypothetical protein